MTSYFIKCIQDYNSIVNYNIIHSKTVSKYLFKAFYNRINKKKYNSQIRKHNIYHTNIVMMKDMIVAAKKNRKNGEQLVMKNAKKSQWWKLQKY